LLAHSFAILSSHLLLMKNSSFWPSPAISTMKLYGHRIRLGM
jgi:hypothetical protein